MIWNVYNLGCVAAGDVTVQLLEEDQPVETVTLERIPPSRDFRLGTARAAFKHTFQTIANPEITS